MKIEINIEKRHLVYILLAIGLMLAGGLAIAAYDPSQGSHSILWTDRIEPKTGSEIIVEGDVTVTGNLTWNGLADILSDSAGSDRISCNWLGWRGGTICTFGDFCESVGAIRFNCVGNRIIGTDLQGCTSCTNR